LLGVHLVHFDVPQTQVLDLCNGLSNHSRRQVHSDDASLRPDLLSRWEKNSPSTGSHVQNHRVGGDLYRLDETTTKM
jgi:hypothetical protein